MAKKLNNNLLQIKYPFYQCHISVKSNCLNQLKTWFFLTFGFEVCPLKLKIKRFTLLRSPLGNKRAKDQFEAKEWSTSITVESKNPSYILFFCQTILIPLGLKKKIRLTKSYKKV